MKLLTKLHDLDEAKSIKYRLEVRGIPIYIGSENSGPAMGAMPAADCYTIWVEIDSQCQCALKVINDDEYEVLSPINIDEFRNSQEASVQNFRQKFSKVNEYILNTIMLGAIACFVFYVLSNM
jgi:hypothetical protein